VLTLVFEKCAADPDWDQKYPKRKETFYQVADDLNANPVKVDINGKSVLVTGNLFMEALWISFYSADSIALTPSRIYSASQGVFSGLDIWFGSIRSDMGTYMAMGFEWSLMCNEEIPCESYEFGRASAANLPSQIADYFDSYDEFMLCESCNLE
jgi:hypothetical protein